MIVYQGPYLPAHPGLQSLDVILGGAGRTGVGHVACVEVREAGYLVGHERTPRTSAVGPAQHPGLVGETVDDQLTSALEEIEQADLAVRPLEHVVLLDC